MNASQAGIWRGRPVRVRRGRPAGALLGPAHHAARLLLLLLPLLSLLLACAALNPLNILPGRGSGHNVYHEVKKGENLYRISKYYGVPVSRIMKHNKFIKNKNHIHPGEMLWIANARQGMQPARSLTPPAAVRSALAAASRGAGGKAGAAPRFVWPTRGRLSSRFGPRWGRMHEGIDIAARRGVQVFSAADGKVIHAGRIGAYGNVVIVKHKGAFATVYAHNHRNQVRKGQRVKQGQVIAQVGATGHATGPHLHFEVRVDEKPRNPLQYLPR